MKKYSRTDPYFLYEKGPFQCLSRTESILNQLVLFLSHEKITTTKWFPTHWDHSLYLMKRNNHFVMKIHLLELCTNKPIRRVLKLSQDRDTITNEFIVLCENRLLFHVQSRSSIIKTIQSKIGLWLRVSITQYEPPSRFVLLINMVDIA